MHNFGIIDKLCIYTKKHVGRKHRCWLSPICACLDVFFKRSAGMLEVRSDEREYGYDQCLH